MYPEQANYLEAKAKYEAHNKKITELTSPIWEKMENGELSQDQAISQVVDIEMQHDDHSFEAFIEAEKTLIEWAFDRLQKECPIQYRQHKHNLELVKSGTTWIPSVRRDVIELALRLA